MNTVREQDGKLLRVVCDTGSVLLRLEGAQVAAQLDDRVAVVALDVSGSQYVSRHFVSDCLALRGALTARRLVLAIIGLPVEHRKALEADDGGSHAVHLFESREDFERSGLAMPPADDAEVTWHEKHLLWG